MISRVIQVCMARDDGFQIPTEPPQNALASAGFKLLGWVDMNKQEARPGSG